MPSKRPSSGAPPNAKAPDRGAGAPSGRAARKDDDTAPSTTRASIGQDIPCDPVYRDHPVEFPIVALGASAGGLDAMEAFLTAMPADAGMAVVIIAHLDPTHVSLLPELLQNRTSMKVIHARDDMAVRPNVVHVIPPNKAMVIQHGSLKLTDLGSPRTLRLPIDDFFRSLAQDLGARAIGIILSGTGSDGTQGLKSIKNEDGLVLVQDPATAKHDGMARSAIGTGLVDHILPPSEMPALLLRYIHRAADESPKDAPSTLSGDAPDLLPRILGIVRTRTGHDFSQYKRNTIHRRIERRMVLHQIDHLESYVQLLHADEREVGILFKECLIGVTSFFRDPGAFEALREQVLLDLVRDHEKEQPLRVWVPGCSTGEEAYSIAIVILEAIETLKRHMAVQIFGTDIDEDAILFARSGLFPKSIAADVDAARLERYFVEEEDGQYRVRKSVRDMLVFAPQSVIKDPPFTKLDLLSCRNLLIYLNSDLQKRLLSLFHYSLRPGGCLLLGSSETISQAADMFTGVSTKWKIFRRSAGGASAIQQAIQIPAARPQGSELKPEGTATARVTALDTVRLVESILGASAMPPCVVIDAEANVLYVHGHTGLYLQLAQGRFSRSLAQIAHPGMRAELMAAVQRASRHREEVRAKGLILEHSWGCARLDLTVKPLQEHAAVQDLLIVMFHPIPSTTLGAAASHRQPPRGQHKRAIHELEKELRYTREHLQSTIEELETSNEELRSTNEELQSTNEELQSTNEEMETSKEELQSLNEESATVNAELQSRIEELSKANDDIRNLLDSTDFAVIFLDTRLCVRRFTPRATDIIPLEGVDAGRPLTHFASNLLDIDLAEVADQVLRDLGSIDKEARTKDGRRLQLRVRPYRTVQNVIDGVVITFTEMGATRKRSRPD